MLRQTTRLIRGQTRRSLLVSSRPQSFLAEMPVHSSAPEFQDFQQEAAVTGDRARFTAPPVTLESVSPLVRDCEYAVRGAIVSRALLLESQLKTNPGSLPFPSVTYCNIGNPQALGQSPVTFFREVLALIDHPDLLRLASTREVGKDSSPFSGTAVQRAERLLQSLPAHASGAYSHSKGMPLCREDVAEGILARDGHKCDPESIFLTDGASPAAQMVMRLLIRGRSDGVLCPIPQYPLYSATIALLGGTLVPYYIQEDVKSGLWRLDADELEAQATKSVQEGVTPRMVVVINPGNPTGQVLDEEEQRGIIEFCARHKLVLLADEVYQENIYAPNKKFTSFKKVARDMGVGADDLALISLQSVSKGYYGECGRRGGYMEVTGLPADVVDQLYKLASVTLCSNISGQVLTSLIMKPPVPGDDAYALFNSEREALLSSLARRAKYIVDRLNAEPGITCCTSEGAMYAFPSLHLPHAALEAAAFKGIAADAFYAQRLLEATGIVVVPGSGFGQKDGSWHLRFTILPAEEELPGMMDRFSAFHAAFMKEFQ